MLKESTTNRTSWALCLQNLLEMARFTTTGEMGQRQHTSQHNTIMADRWIHVAVRWTRAAGADLFIDGVYQPSLARPDDITWGSGPLRLGSSVHEDGDTNGATDGYIDDTRLYRGALSDADIATLAIEP